MRKSFHAMLIESEQEFTYYVKSIRNIHDDEMIEKIALALTPHELIEIEADGFKPMAENNDLFPEYPNTPTYTIRVKLGMEIVPETAVQSIAMFTNINDEQLLVHEKGKKADAKTEDDTHDETITDKEAQDMAGEKRIGAFLQDLEKERKERADGVVRDVYETFSVPYNAVSKVVGEPVPKGFYLVEHFDDSPGVATITGPFKKQPMNYEYVHSLAPCKVLSEDAEGDQRIFKVTLDERDPDSITPPGAGQKWEVEVMDTDSGRKYDVVVDAPDSTSARNEGIEVVARNTRINPEQLIALKPEE